MGWWGEGIMDGDDPMDWAAEIRDICGNGYAALGDRADLPLFTEQILYDHEDEIAAKAAELHDVIFYEVWGYLLTEEAKSQSIREDRRKAILAAIDKDILDVSSKWLNPEGRLYHLRVLREAVANIGTGRVVSLQGHLRQRLQDEAQGAVQKAYDHRHLSDPSVVQRALVLFIDNLTETSELDDWRVAAQTIENIGRMMANACKGGLPLEDAVEVVRPLTGA